MNTFLIKSRSYRFDDVLGINQCDYTIEFEHTSEKLTPKQFGYFLMKYGEWIQENVVYTDGWYHASYTYSGSNRYILYVKDNKYYAPWVCSEIFSCCGGDLDGGSYDDFKPLNWGPLNDVKNAENVVKNFGRWCASDWIYNG